MQKQLEPIISKVAEELGVPYEVCKDAYMSQWHFILEKLGTYNLREMSIEEFRQTKRNFNLPSIGKFCVTERKFLSTKKAYEYINNKRNQHVQNKEDTSDVQYGDNHDERV